MLQAPCKSISILLLQPLIYGLKHFCPSRSWYQVYRWPVCVSWETKYETFSSMFLIAWWWMIHCTFELFAQNVTSQHQLVTYEEMKSFSPRAQTGGGHVGKCTFFSTKWSWSGWSLQCALHRKGEKVGSDGSWWAKWARLGGAVNGDNLEPGLIWELHTCPGPQGQPFHSKLCQITWKRKNLHQKQCISCFWIATSVAMQFRTSLCQLPEVPNHAFRICTRGSWVTINYLWAGHSYIIIIMIHKQTLRCGYRSLLAINGARPHKHSETPALREQRGK